MPINPTPLGVVIAFVGGYRAAVFLCVALVAILAFGVQSWRLDRAQGKAGSCAVDVANFGRTQAGNLATITDLQQRLAVDATKRKIEADASLAAINSLIAEVARVDAARDTLNVQLEKLYAQDQGARGWGTAGVDAGVLARLPDKPPAR